MPVSTVFLLAFGLSMDAFAVSVTQGMARRPLRLSNALQVALFFAAFQALMPLVGWTFGLAVRDFIAICDHWLALLLLGLLGGRMIWNGITGRGSDEDRRMVDLGLMALLGLSVATSIDALVVGFTLLPMLTSVLLPVAVIGGVTLALSLLGCWLGQCCRRCLQRHAELLGGVVLVGIGLQVFLRHTGLIH